MTPDPIAARAEKCWAEVAKSLLDFGYADAGLGPPPLELAQHVIARHLREAVAEERERCRELIRLRVMDVASVPHHDDPKASFVSATMLALLTDIAHRVDSGEPIRKRGTT